MSVDIFLKSGIGLLGASAVSLGGYSLHNHLTATLESGYALMSEGNENWGKLVTAYETANDSGSDQKPKKMEGFSFDQSSSDDNDSKKEKLISHCKKILKTSLRETEEILNKRKAEIETWCTEKATALGNQKN